MFSNAKIGDRVYSWTNGWGTIKNITHSGFPISVEFDNGVTSAYTVGGFSLETDSNPSLFWDKPQFEIPEKPFYLKAEYKKLEKKEYDEGGKNWFMYRDPINHEWSIDWCTYIRAVGVTFFAEDSIDNFTELLNNNNVTFEQLEQVIREVENEKL